MIIPGRGFNNTLIRNTNTGELFNINDSITLTTQNVVSIDPATQGTQTTKTYSIRLKNWVEPYEIAGFIYSLFYTEVDHNYKVGDRVFIEGGIYDSDAFILRKGYGKGVDGYKVLYVDRAKIVLNILYTGESPSNEEPIDNFIKVWVANNQYEFDYYSQVLSLRADDDLIKSKFQLGYNNFLYLNGTFSIDPGTYKLDSFLLGLTGSGVSELGNSFVVRGTQSSNYFIDITSDVLSGNVTPYLNQGYADKTNPFYNNLKIRVMNGNFTISEISFKEGFIYFYNSGWKIDKTYLPTIITEGHFRRGIFESGTFNQGLFGQHEERISWKGDNIEWNLGSTLNVDWKSGVLGSNHFDTDSWFTIFDRNGLPQMRANSVNNGGSGYNYIFNTDFTGGDVINGNIYNMKVIYGTNSNQFALDNWLSNVESDFSVSIKGGVYYNSDIIFASVSNSTLISSYVVNSLIRNSKSVNSEIESSLFENSTWISDNIVKIQEYEESNIIWYDKDSSVNYKMYKFYLSENNWLRLREFGNFYFNKLGINILSDELLNFFDDKFSLGHWEQSYDSYGGKKFRKVLVQLSTAAENRNSPGVISGEDNNVEPNDISLPSLDIFIEGGEDFEFQNSEVYPRIFKGDTIDISSAYILDSDFKSGLFKDSTWVSGNYFNYNSDYSFQQSGSYDITSDTNNRALKVKVEPKRRVDLLGLTTSQSNIVFLNGIWYDGSSWGENLLKLKDTWRILSENNREFILQDVLTQSSLSTVDDSKFIAKTPNAKNKYNYLHPVKFLNSNIQSGIFRRAYFEKCNFNNDLFNSNDKDFTDVNNKRNLIISDVIFDGDSNTINNGLIQYSHFISGSDKWNGGIFHRGVWNTNQFDYSDSSATDKSTVKKTEENSFTTGIFRNSSWEGGIFRNGLFYKNRVEIPVSSTVLTNHFTFSFFYYYDNGSDTKTRWSFQNGEFRSGDFEKSNFEAGTILNANFYDSDFISGSSIGTNFGKNTLPFDVTRVWSGTFSQTNVINAQFKARNPLSDDVENTKIYWNSGVFNSGLFGVFSFTSSYVPFLSDNNEAIWFDGTFNNGQFTDSAVWKNGTFNNGRFTSYFGQIQSDLKTPLELSNFSGTSFSWQNGKFNGGEFGNSDLEMNSTWFKGEFNGGKFKGRYWHNGIITRGEFLGSATQSTDKSSYNSFIRGFHNRYYGFWNSGWASKNKDLFTSGEKIYTEIERESSARRRDRETIFKNSLWNSGTFSNFDASFENSLFLSGTFEEGYFFKSSFNPYINLLDNLTNISSDITINNLLDKEIIYTLSFDIIENNGGSVLSPFSTPIGALGYFEGTFSSTSKNFTLDLSGNLTLNNLVLYPGTQSGFRKNDLATWKNGEAYSSDIYYSTWHQGVFNSFESSNQGNAWGIIWKNGINKYMNAYNVLWENGIWKNGNWFGTPFTEVSNNSGSYSVQILLNQPIYGSSGSLTEFKILDGSAYQIFENSVTKPSLQELLGQTFNNNSGQYDIFTSTNSISIKSNQPFEINLSIECNILNLNNFIFYSNGDVINLQNDFYGTNQVSISSNKELEVRKGFTYDILENINNKFDFGLHITNVVNPLTNKYSSINNTQISTLSLPDGIKFNSVSLEDENLIKNSNFVSTQFWTDTRNVEFSDGKVSYKWVSGLWDGLLNQNLSVSKNSNYQLNVKFNVFNPDVILRLQVFNKEFTQLIKLLNFGPYDSISSINETMIFESGNFDEVVVQILFLTTPNNPTDGIEVTQLTCNKVNFIYPTFGNGQMIGTSSGNIWENGIWNSGWRQDYTTIWCDNLSKFAGGKNKSYQVSRNIWRFELALLSESSYGYPGKISFYKPGDKVSLGNIVAIDINGKRRLIRDFFTIISIIGDKIILEIPINFSIRGIEKDSDDHFIYISKNIWLNGVFLNGRFKDGVWNNGLFRGYPYITTMNDSHWIDGVFKGGRWKSGLTYSKSTGVIQKFIFSDENVSGEPFKFKHNSWIDANYIRESGVNINKINSVYKQTSLGLTTSFIENNYYGNATKDVLESISTIRNGFDLESRSYRLGWKFTEYTNFLDGVGEFLDINESYYLNTQTFSTTGLGYENFTNDGWTFSYLSVEQGFATSSNSIISNIGGERTAQLILSGGRDYSPSVPFDDNSNFVYNLYDNINTKQIFKRRYSFAEVTMEDYSTPGNTPVVFYNNFPSDYSLASFNLIFNNNEITIPLNQLGTSSVTRQREYFFNKQSLELSIFAGPTYSFGIKEIKFIETDMIPFFQFTSDCIKKQRFVTWDTAPVVDYPGTTLQGPNDPPEGSPGTWEFAMDKGSISVFDKEGNLDVIPEYGSVTWDNFYLANEGEGCESYINSDIKVPLRLIAKDIPPGVAGFTYLTSELTSNFVNLE